MPGASRWISLNVFRFAVGCLYAGGLPSSHRTAESSFGACFNLLAARYLMISRMMARPRSRQRNVERLARAVSKAFLVAFRAQAEIDHCHLIHIASIHHNPRQQTVARRILFLAAFKRGLVPKPTSTKSKSVVPCHRPIVNFQHAQSNYRRSHQIVWRVAPEKTAAPAWPDC